MVLDVNRRTAELALQGLKELGTVTGPLVLVNLRLLRDAVGKMQDGDAIARSNAWWAICRLCDMMSRHPGAANLPAQWQRAVELTSIWVETFAITTAKPTVRDSADF